MRPEPLFGGGVSREGAGALPLTWSWPAWFTQEGPAAVGPAPDRGWGNRGQFRIQHIRAQWAMPSFPFMQLLLVVVVGFYVFCFFSTGL
jgi:hypothetical protein